MIIRLTVSPLIVNWALYFPQKRGKSSFLFDQSHEKKVLASAMPLFMTEMPAFYIIVEIKSFRHRYRYR